MSQAVLAGHKDGVLCLAVDPLCPHILASGSEDATVRVWDLTTRRSSRCVRRVFGDAPVASVAWLAPVAGGDGTAASCCPHLFAAAGNAVYVFDLRRPEVILDTADATFNFNTDEVNQVCAARDGRGAAIIAAADDSGAVCLINADSGKLLKVLRRHTMFASAIDVRPGEGSRPLELVSGGFDCALHVWDVSKGKPRATANVTTAGITAEAPTVATLNPPYPHSVAYSPSHTRVCAGLGDGSIALFSRATNFECESREWSHTRAVGRAEFLCFPWAVEGAVVSCGNDGKVLVTDVRSAGEGRTRGKWKGKGKGVSGGAAAASEVAAPSAADAPATAIVEGEGGAIGDESAAPGRVLYCIDHKAGPNWVTSSPVGGGTLIVADTSGDITLYEGVEAAVRARWDARK